MDEESINGLIGQLNLGLMISDDLVSIPAEDAKEIIICLETLKNYIWKPQTQR